MVLLLTEVVSRFGSSLFLSVSVSPPPPPTYTSHFFSQLEELNSFHQDKHLLESLSNEMNA